MPPTTSDQLVTLPGDPGGIDGAATIFEELLLDSVGAVDRGLIRQVVREAETAFPGDVTRCWWQWVGEAGANLGLKCKVADCSVRELSELAREGVKLIFYVPGSQPWRSVTGFRDHKFRLGRASEDEVSRWGNRRQLIEHLGNPDTNTVVRCVIVEPSQIYHVISDGEHGETMTPLKRLLALLKPEKSDLFFLVVFSFVVGMLSLATPVAVDALVTAVTFTRLLQPLVILAIILFAFLSFSAALRLLKAYMVEIIQCRLFARVAADLTYRIPRVQTQSVEHLYLPELVNRFFDTATVQKVSAVLLLDGLQLGINATVGLAMLALYHPWLLGFAAALLASMSLLLLLLGRGAVATSIKESKCKYAIAEWLEDLARCTVAFKLDGGAEYALERGDQLIHAYLTARRKHFRVLVRQIAFALGLQAVASAVLLGIGGLLVMRDQLTLGQLVAAELIITVIVGSFAKLGKSMESFYDLLASIDKLGALFDLPIEHPEGLLNPFPLQPAKVVAHHGVDYWFPNGIRGLDPITFEIDSGERILLAGLGKSVLMDLMFGLRQPSHGHFTIDGIDTRDLRPDLLRRRVALAREIEVFHRSISENVHLMRPDVTLNAVRDALELVGLLDGVSRLADGISTELTSRGAPLTRSQLCRLMLARAIVGRPGLLLIDGVLDSLPDDEAEELARMLSDPRQPWTLLMASSRSSLQQYCDRVLDLGANPQHDLPDLEPGGDDA
jgi:ABC-type bacteriocin/lantibiotic exporter with double-glycine peptidase domain